jgi:hypothetical protein
MEPSSFPIGLNIKPSSLHVDAQVNLSIIDCPAGMIPILRNSKLGQIIVHNIDQVFKPNTQHQVSFLTLLSEWSSITGLLYY